jgi:hypothetical protein
VAQRSRFLLLENLGDRASMSRVVTVLGLAEPDLILLDVQTARSPQ